MKRYLLLLASIAISGCISAAPIHEAIEAGNVDKVKSILKDNPQEALKQQDRYGYYPIHVAALQGQAEILDTLIEQGADVNRNAQLVEPEIITDVPEDDEEVTPLEELSQEKLQNLMDERTPLQVAVLPGNTSSVRRLLKAGADPNIYEGIMSSPLVTAIIWGHTEIIDVVLEYKHKLHLQNPIIPAIAIKMGQLETLKKLISAGSPVTFEKHNITLLHVAAVDNQPQIVAWLLQEKKLDPNKKGESGNTPLMLTTDVDIVRHLLDHNADPNIQNENGDTALHMATSNGKPEIVTLLLKHGAKPNIGGQNNVTPLHIIAEAKETPLVGFEMARSLITAGADVNAQATGSITPLHIAALSGSKEFAQFLLTKGADPTMRTSLFVPIGRPIPRWATAIDMARQQGHEEIAQLLQQTTNEKKGS